MGRNRTHKTSGRLARSSQRSAWALQYYERGQYWHVSGTVKAGRAKRRFRKSTGVPSHRDRSEAEAVGEQLAEEEFERMVRGASRTPEFATLVTRYQNQHRLRALAATEIANIEFWLYAMTDQGQKVTVRKLREIGAKPKSLTTDQITADLIDRVVALNFSGAKATTVERYKNTLNAIFQLAKSLELIDRPPPNLNRNKAARNSATRRHINTDWFTEAETVLFVELAKPHLKPILAVMACVGGRVTGTLNIRVRDIDLTPGKEQVFYRITKNNEPAWSALHPGMVPFIADWLARHPRRNDPDFRDSPAFLTHKGLPFVDRQGRYGGQIKSAFKTLRKAVANHLVKIGQGDRARHILNATPHWFRHSIATNMFKKGADLKTVMDQAQWKDLRMPLRYASAVPEHVRAVVGRLDLGSPITEDTGKTDDRSGLPEESSAKGSKSAA